jgi:hypothetical protein
LTYEKKGEVANAKADYEKALSLSAGVDAGLARPSQAKARERLAALAAAEAARVKEAAERAEPEARAKAAAERAQQEVRAKAAAERAEQDARAKAAQHYYPPGVGGAAASRPPRLWAVRGLIEPAEMPPRDGVGYGIVAFTTRPLSHDIERYKSVCEAYKATLISVLELPPNTPPSEQMVTYWPITNKNTPEAQRADCPYLVSNYALRLGLDAIQDADKQNQELASRRGPFLIAWAPSESRFVPDAVVLVLDLSDKASQRSFIEVFQDWRQKITDNPEVWRRQNGFNIELVRRIIRDTFDRYGDGVLRLISRP